MDGLLENAIKNIREHHRKIIDDWCKAYLSELYERGYDIKPGCFVLNEQQIHEKDGKMVKSYWFSLRDEPYHFDEEF